MAGVFTLPLVCTWSLLPRRFNRDLGDGGLLTGCAACHVAYFWRSKPPDGLAGHFVKKQKKTVDSNTQPGLGLFNY